MAKKIQSNICGMAGFPVRRRLAEETLHANPSVSRSRPAHSLQAMIIASAELMPSGTALEVVLEMSDR